jgi:acyl-CoA thioesterase-2
VLAYVSDFNLLGTAKLAHRGYFGQPDLMMASLDHVIWFHQDVHLDDWMLYSMESPIAHAARCLVSGRIFDHSGRLIASVAQEGLMRPVVHAG